MNNKNRVPLVHISKRAALPWYKAWAIRAAAIILALIVCAVITTVFTGEDPIQVYAAMFEGAFGTSRRTWVLLQNLAILLCISLAVTPAFKMRFWNIGAEGQVLAGALAVAALHDTHRRLRPRLAAHHHRGRRRHRPRAPSGPLSPPSSRPGGTPTRRSSPS